jgi:hypothetical protein
VVHAHPERVKTEAKKTFQQDVKKWTDSAFPQALTLFRRGKLGVSSMIKNNINWNSKVLLARFFAENYARKPRWSLMAEILVMITSKRVFE